MCNWSMLHVVLHDTYWAQGTMLFWGSMYDIRLLISGKPQVDNSMSSSMLHLLQWKFDGGN